MIAIVYKIIIMTMNQRADGGDRDKYRNWPNTDRWTSSVLMWEHIGVSSRVTDTV